MNRSELARIARKHGTPVVVIDHDDDPPQLRELQAAPARRCRPTTRSRPTPPPRSCARSTGRAPASTWRRCPSSCWCTRTCGVFPPGRGRISSGTRSSTRTPSSREETLRSPRPVPPARHLRQPGGARQDQGARAPRGRRAAPAGPEHGLDGGAVLEVRLRPRRGGGPRRRGLPDRPRGGGAELPRRQPVHQLRQLRPGAQHGGGRPERGAHPRPRPQDPRHRRRLSRGLRPRTSSPSAPSRARSTPRSPGSSRRDIEILAEPGRYLVATAATSVARVIGKAVRDGKPSYYIDDSVYHTYSGIIFDHCQYSVKAFRRGSDRDLGRLRPDLRRARHHLALGEPARARDRRPRLLREHRGLLATRRRPGSTASRRRRSCTSTSSRPQVGDYGPVRPPALGSPVGGGAWSVAAGGPSSSVRIGFKPSAQTS